MTRQTLDEKELVVYKLWRKSKVTTLHFDCRVHEHFGFNEKRQVEWNLCDAKSSGQRVNNFVHSRTIAVVGLWYWCWYIRYRHSTFFGKKSFGIEILQSYDWHHMHVYSYLRVPQRTKKNGIHIKIGGKMRTTTEKRKKCCGKVCE